MKQLSIVIVNYNVVHFLELCLSSVFKAITQLDAEVIVVDNASSDTSCEMIRSRFPKVVLITNKDNVGFATANNQGVAVARGEYVCVLNPDTVVGEDLFNTVYAFAKTNKKLGAIGVRLVDGTGTFLPESKRNLPTPKVAFNKLFRTGDSYYANNVEAQKRGGIHVLVGAFMFMTKKIYQEAGGFDEQYFMYGEDIDLSHTIVKLGYTNYYLGDQAVIHFKGESTAKNAVYRKRFYNAMHIFYKKHIKRNWVEGCIVNCGLWFARNLSRTSSFSHNRQLVKPSKYVVVSASNKRIQAMKKSLNISLNQKEVLPSIDRDTEYFLDMELLSYQDCINFMLENRDKGVTFKFIPENSSFALGSNTSEGRGSLLYF